MDASTSLLPRHQQHLQISTSLQTQPVAVRSMASLFGPLEMEEYSLLTSTQLASQQIASQPSSACSPEEWLDLLDDFGCSETNGLVSTEMSAARLSLLLGRLQSLEESSGHSLSRDGKSAGRMI